ncbi:excinuclease ABC subunit UvrC [Solimonas variicoloris]|uniref:excinuclease ABC subunit UvrC n=1 Tax=Solimonas variicoloris TaxID=254408 RepID=UPI0003801342|nr:excinuclease ABC subunit UvrC [Solimonas variicoloris]
MSETFDHRSFLQQLTTQPGVYRMFGAGDELLYVGKARNLKKRVSTYFLRASGNPRIESMVSQIRRVEVTVTRTEDEALLLEANLIKEFGPRYNVMYRDDKSYPYVRFSAHRYPRISYYRGAKQAGERYFGPFPSASAVRETLNTLQKLFQLRPCRDSFFAHRDRPCLQHQIKRCSAPCVGLIGEADYGAELRKAERLLEGKADELADELAVGMQNAADRLDFELAARLRDQIAALKRVRESRVISGGADDLDLVVVAEHASSSCVVVMSVRDGVNLGHRSHFPRHAAHTPPAELLESFISQHYLEQPAPPEILVSHALDEQELLEEALGRRAGRKVSIGQPQRGTKRRLLEMALNTAAQALSTRLVEAASMDQRLIELQRALDLDAAPRRLECFDISHTMGEKAVASCVVFNEEGPLKSAYRKFNIDGVTPGDDYAAIKQAVQRRFARLKSGEGQAPDVLFIDGGQGQLNAALEALDELEIGDQRVVAIAKGPTRRPGLEELLLPEREHGLTLPPDSPALHLIQRIRDEAHRFAITGHRGRRDKARVSSGLEAIEGLGPARRRALLKAFGGLAQLKRASVDDLARVDGVSRTLAERVYAHFH